MRYTLTLLVIGWFGCCTEFAHAGAAERALSKLCPHGDVDTELVEREAHRTLIHPALLAALIAHESRCRSKAKSGRGDFGAGQLRLGCSAARGATASDLLDPAVNVRLAASHLARCLVLCGGFSGLSVYSGISHCKSSKYSREVARKFLSTFGR